MNECPTCHRPFGGEHRTCFACKKPVGRRDKFHFEGCYIVHDDCQNPTLKPLVPTSEPAAQVLLEPREAFEEIP